MALRYILPYWRHKYGLIGTTSNLMRICVMDETTRVACTSRIYVATMLRTIVYTLRVLESTYGADVESNREVLIHIKELTNKTIALYSEIVDLYEYKDLINSTSIKYANEWIAVWKEELLCNTTLDSMQ